MKTCFCVNYDIKIVMVILKYVMIKERLLRLPLFFIPQKEINRSCQICRVYKEIISYNEHTSGRQNKNIRGSALDYSLDIYAILTWIETHIHEKTDYGKMGQSVGMSYRNIREVFKKATGNSLARYIVARKVANAAFEIYSTSKSLTEIAFDYGYDNYDTFRRVFTRDTGVSPSAFRKHRIICGRKHVCMGMFAPAIQMAGYQDLLPLRFTEAAFMNQVKKTVDSCILYGIPKVTLGNIQDGTAQYTPFPICLQAVLDYLGTPVHYSQLMAASGAAFRLRWGLCEWDMSAVDIRNIFYEPDKAFELTFRSVGRKYTILESAGSNQAEMFRLIQQEINAGRPLIGLGVVGPPEACIITGYQDNGNELLGWSLFQESLEFGGDVACDESGYFVAGNWFMHTDSIIAIGEQISPGLPLKELLTNALDLMKQETMAVNEHDAPAYAGGQSAYRQWAQAMRNDRNFIVEDTKLHELLYCFSDAQLMVADGRSYGAGYIRWIGSRYPRLSALCNACADSMEASVAAIVRIVDMVGIDLPVVMESMKDKNKRLAAAAQIDEAARHEKEATDNLELLLQEM